MIYLRIGNQRQVDVFHQRVVDRDREVKGASVVYGVEPAPRHHSLAGVDAEERLEVRGSAGQHGEQEVVFAVIPPTHQVGRHTIVNR